MYNCIFIQLAVQKKYNFAKEGICMKKIFLIFAFFLQVINCCSQKISPDYDYRNIGSAKKLSGKTYVLVLFVSYKYAQDWTKEEMDEIYQKIFNAFSWLKKSAKKYNSEVDFSLFVLGDNEKIKMDYIPQGPFEGAYSTEMLKLAMYEADYDKKFDFVEYTHQTIGSDNCVVYVCCNTYGRSFALPVSLNFFDYYKKNGSNRDLLEGCVLYKGFDTLRPLYSSVIAHETLHLFGAADLYDVYGGDDSVLDKKMQRYFPTSIMRRTPYDIEDAEVDKLTAFLVGISSSYESRFDEFLNQ